MRMTDGAGNTTTITMNDGEPLVVGKQWDLQVSRDQARGAAKSALQTLNYNVTHDSGKSEIKASRDSDRTDVLIRFDSEDRVELSVQVYYRDKPADLKRVISEEYSEAPDRIFDAIKAELATREE